MPTVTYIRPADGKCQDCSKVAELRPYGKGGKFVCFDCAMKDEDEAKRRFGAILEAGQVVIDARNTSPRCPVCKAKDVVAHTPRTTYACGSSDYDQRPGTFKQSPNCRPQG